MFESNGYAKIFTYIGKVFCFNKRSKNHEQGANQNNYISRQLKNNDNEHNKKKKNRNYRTQDGNPLIPDLSYVEKLREIEVFCLGLLYCGIALIISICFQENFTWFIKLPTPILLGEANVLLFWIPYLIMLIGITIALKSFINYSWFVFKKDFSLVLLVVIFLPIIHGPFILKSLFTLENVVAYLTILICYLTICRVEVIE